MNLFGSSTCGNGCLGNLGGILPLIVILSLFGCGCNNGCGCDNDNGSDDLVTLLLLLALLGGSGCGCDNGNSCGCARNTNSCGCQ